MIAMYVQVEIQIIYQIQILIVMEFALEVLIMMNVMIVLVEILDYHHAILYLNNQVSFIFINQLFRPFTLLLMLI